MSTLKVNSIQKINGDLLVNSGTPAQTVVNRNTTPFSTASSTYATAFSTSITTLTVNPTILCYVYMSHRTDQGAGWNLAYFRVDVGSTLVMDSGYNGCNTNWIHDFTAEKPYYVSAAAGSTFTFDLKIKSYSGTQYMNTPSSDASDGYAIMKLTEIAP